MHLRAVFFLAYLNFLSTTTKLWLIPNFNICVTIMSVLKSTLVAVNSRCDGDPMRSHGDPIASWIHLNSGPYSPDVIGAETFYRHKNIDHSVSRDIK